MIIVGVPFKLFIDGFYFYFYQFLSSLSAGRSSALERIRSNASSVFNSPEGTSNTGTLQLDQALFATGVNRSQNKRVCKLLGIADGGKTFPVLPPILFSRENPNVMSRLFFHPSLFRVIKLVLSHMPLVFLKLHH